MKPSTSLSFLLLSAIGAQAYLTPQPLRQRRRSTFWLAAVEPGKPTADDVQEEFRGASFKTTINSDTDSSVESDRSNKVQAATRTVNERLLAELEEAANKEKYGTRSQLTKKFSLEMFQSKKTDEERKAAIEEARNLNGVNPVVTGVASVVALAAAFGLWQATTSLGVFFALHPVESDWYVVQRSTAVFRNVAIGLVSLGAGFCGVTGLGILLLTGRVAIGVAKGELDPTPLPSKAGEEVEIPNIWDLMLNKKPNRRSGGKDLFGP